MEMHEHIAAFNKVNRTHCFLHILNLEAKSLLKGFELPEKRESDFTDEEQEVLGDLAEMADELRAEEAVTQSELDQDLEADELPDDDELDEWLDAIQLTPEEEKELREKVIPITCVLVKVSEKLICGICIN